MQLLLALKRILIYFGFLKSGQRYSSNMVKQYDKYGENAATDWTLGYHVITETLQPLKGKRILDYGAGTGKFSQYMYQKGATVIGVDTSLEMIELARQHGPAAIDYRVIQSADLSALASNSIDIVTINFVLCTISTKHEISDVLKAAFRVLVPGGVLAIMNVNWDEANGHSFQAFQLENVKVLSSGQKVKVFLKQQNSKVLTELIDYFWSKDEYLKLIEATGFMDTIIKQPIAQDQNPVWIDESKVAPFTLYFTKK